MFDRYVLPTCLTAMCCLDNGSSRHWIVTRRAVVAVRLRWFRLIFDREAALVAVDLGLFLSDLLQNGPSRHRIVTRPAVVAVRLR